MRGGNMMTLVIAMMALAFELKIDLDLPEVADAQIMARVHGDTQVQIIEV